MAANERALFGWPLKEAASRRRSGGGCLRWQDWVPGSSRSPRERVSVEEVTERVPPPPEAVWKDAAGGRRGPGRALQEVDGSGRRLGTGRCPVGATHISRPAGVGGLAVRCAGFPRADLTPTQSWVWAEKDGHPKSPIPTTLF